MNSRQNLKDNEVPSTYPKPGYFDEYSLYLQAQGKSKGTIQQYLYALKNIPNQVEAYFGDPNLDGKALKVAAYRSWLQFATRKKKILTHSDLLTALDIFKPPRKLGNKHSDKKWSIPKKQWAKHIKKVPTRVGKMGVYLGFHSGLRLNEILHLRVQDIDFENGLILIRPHKRKKNQEFWYPKYNRERQIPFNLEQADALKRWINDYRPKDLPTPYLLWTVRGPRQYKIVQPRAFQRWVKIASLHPHILRYSFATHWYELTKDIKFVCDMLGHSNVSTTSEYLQLGKKESLEKARKYFAQA